MHRSMRAVITAATVLATPAISHAQRVRPPRACTNTTPATVVSPARGGPISAVITDEPARLWVLYGDRTAAGTDTVALLEIEGLSTQSLSVNLHPVGEGSSTQGALAVAGGHVVATYVRADGRVGVFFHPMAGGADVHATLDAPQRPTALTVAGVGTRALVAWDDARAGVRTAWLEPNGAPVVRAVAGRFGAPAATSAFGGALLVEDRTRGDARLGMWRVSGPARVAPVPAARGATVASISAVSAGRGTMALFSDGVRAHLSVLEGPNGAGRDRVLGLATGGSETALTATAWGAFAVWTDDGVVRLAPVATNGGWVGAAFGLSDPSTGERARTPAVASWGSNAVVLWSANGRRADGSEGPLLRMVRVSCN
jgi:hypothetical protein